MENIRYDIIGALCWLLVDLKRDFDDEEERLDLVFVVFSVGGTGGG